MSTANSTDQELPANWEDLAEEAEPVESSEDDELVCPRCFTPFESSGHSSEPISHMCLNCGGPISGVALWDPISRIWGEGFGYRQITRVGSEPKLAHVIGVWVIFAPTLTLGSMSILSTFGLSNRFHNDFGAPLGRSRDFSAFIALRYVGCYSTCDYPSRDN